MHTHLRPFASAGLLALLAVGLTPTFGQTVPAPSDQATSAASDQAAKDQNVVQLNTFVVSGLRGSLASAEEIKENSQEIVDSIVASDIDKLPDINVSYALARIPDVQLAHTFSGLGGNGAVTIDGLNQIVSTLDGHEVMTPGGIANGTAGVGVGQRTFDYSQIPSALVAGIDVYRTSAANQLDGGLSGVVDVRMRKPFDFSEGFGGGGTFGTAYSVLKGGENQNYNLFANYTAKTAFGKMGLLISVSDITTPWREDSDRRGARPASSASGFTSAPWTS